MDPGPQWHKGNQSADLYAEEAIMLASRVVLHVTIRLMLKHT